MTDRPVLAIRPAAPHGAAMRGRMVWVGAAAGCVGGCALFWPGIAETDTIDQYQQVLTGDWRDWHPPIMARWWGVLHAGVGGGAAPMLVVQMALYWLGLALLARALADTGRPRAAVGVLAVGAWPPLFGWEAVVLKDPQMVAALVAAVGIVGGQRLRGRPLGWPALAAVAVLLGYAALVRANAVFAIAPLVALLAPWGWRARAVGGVALVLAVLAAAGPIDHRLLGAEPTGVEYTQPDYDLVGIAVRIDRPADAGFTPAEAQALHARRCSSPFFWDPLGDPGRCKALVRPIEALPVGRAYALLASAALRHPLAYLAHRFGHWNATERWLVPAGLQGGSPFLCEPNDLGLSFPGRAGMAVLRALDGVFGQPLCWPICWTVAAVTGLALATRRPRAPARDLALALLGSAVALEGSFLVVSIASDWRYHLWPMAATPLAWVLLLPARAGERRVLVAGGVALALVAMTGTATRWTWPPAPEDYQAMLAF